MSILSSDILFYHIPKAAGNSLFQRLGRDCGTVPVNFRSMDVNSFQHCLERPEHMIWTSHPCGGFECWDRLCRVRPKHRKITMLRRPLDRYVSHYYYNAHWLEKQNVSLEDTITKPVSEHFMVDNLQTKIIAADAASFDYSLPATGELLERAKEKLLGSFVFFGLVEYFEVSYRLLANVLDFRPSTPPVRANEGPVNNYMDLVPKSLKDRIEAYNIYDLELYRFACDHFAATLERALTGRRVGQMEHAVSLTDH
ncbi:sulfotransferase family 2 domain-containing protein [Maridesulfovibrio sp.]|uniref:sulfotransferase family 2 domain-containing protein n=1 Tax=Maridesulfovibrio sp. TaxID=2795000 RepID=UPI002A1889FC|nr:sulfotransferase family 2 domain-containing protein [Maridesulfovibrio sp.]